MKLNELNQKIENYKKGTYIKMVHQSFPCTNKGQIDYHKRVRKVTSSVVRLGLEYSNLASQKGKETQGLPYGYFTKKNYIIENVKNNMFSQQLRVYLSKSVKHKAKVQWYLDDKEVTKEWLYDNGYLTQAQYERKSSIDDCFNISIENIISLGE